MRAGGWKSPKVAEGYVKNSFNYKKQTAEMITSTITSRTTYVADSVDDVGDSNKPNAVFSTITNDIVMSQGYKENAVGDESEFNLEDLESVEQASQSITMRSDVGSAEYSSESKKTIVPLPSHGLPKTFHFENCEINFYMK